MPQAFKPIDMRLKTIEKLCCPFDKADLTLQIFAQTIDHNITEGLLSCATCRRNYPIIYGVPIMAPDEYRQLKLEQPVVQQWQLEHGISEIQLLPFVSTTTV
ncbi:hypothetical protein GCM10023149_22490 [Mucilaginibacter gynuensis]|uniref:Trm112p-like protein n=2 Tax=Mucilaginibacter gynuensis TaxID=1302236 RepID=A0ABP8GDH9_9SPHI